MKNYVAPELEVINAEALNVLTITSGDVDIDGGSGFF